MGFESKYEGEYGSWGEEVKAIREGLGLNKREFAKYMAERGVVFTVQTISNWETKSNNSEKGHGAFLKNQALVRKFAK